MEIPGRGRIPREILDAYAAAVAGSNGHADEPESHADVTDIERGRYRLVELQDGSWAILRALDTCERCRDCDCGEQAEPARIPSFVVSMVKAQLSGKDGGAGMKSRLAAMFGGNGG